MLQIFKRHGLSLRQSGCVSGPGAECSDNPGLADQNVPGVGRPKAAQFSPRIPVYKRRKERGRSCLPFSWYAVDFSWRFFGWI